MTPTDDDYRIVDDPLFDPTFDEKLRKGFKEKMAKLSPEERRAWMERLVAKLGLRSVIMPRYPMQPPEGGEPE